MRIFIAVPLIIAAVVVGAPRVHATPIFFDWVCSSNDGLTVTACPYGLNLVLGFKQEIIDNLGDTFTGMDNILESLSFTTTLGQPNNPNAGFTTTLADLTGASNIAEKANFQVVFDAGKQKIKRLNDATNDTLLWVGFDPAPGAIRFTEGTGQLSNPGDYTYSINRIQDANPFYAPAPLSIDGIFVRRAAPPAPEPSGFWLIAGGLCAFLISQRRRVKSDPGQK